MLQLLPECMSEPEYVTKGNVRYFKGRNGKLWRCPPVQYHYRELFELMSAGFYGWPSLSPAEQAAFDVVMPFLHKLTENAADQFDDLAQGEPTCWVGSGPAMDIDPEMIAYRIAEELVAEGWTPPPADR